MCEQKTVAELIEVIQSHPERKRRLRAIQALAATAVGDDPEGTIAQALGEAMQKGDPWVRRAAAQTLAAMDTAAAAAVLESCLSHANKYVRRAAVKALAQRGGDMALEVLERALVDRHSEVRQVAVALASSVDATRAAERFAPLLDRKGTPFVRASVARALGKVGHRGLIGALKSRLWFFRMEDPRVKAACKEALREIEEFTRDVATLPAAASAHPPRSETLPRPAPQETLQEDPSATPSAGESVE